MAGSLAAACAAGMVAFFAPCCAGVMMPAYLAAIGGGKRLRVAQLTAVYVAGVALVGVSVVAMGQARRVGVLRRAVAGGDESLAASLAANVRTTDVLRAAIAAFTLVAVVLEAAAIAQR